MSSRYRNFDVDCGCDDCLANMRKADKQETAKNELLDLAIVAQEISYSEVSNATKSYVLRRIGSDIAEIAERF